MQLESTLGTATKKSERGVKAGLVYTYGFMSLSIKSDMLSSAFTQFRMPITFLQIQNYNDGRRHPCAKSHCAIRNYNDSDHYFGKCQQRKKYIEDKVKQLESAHLFTENVTF